LTGIYRIKFTLVIAKWEEEELALKIACDGKLAMDRLN